MSSEVQNFNFDQEGDITYIAPPPQGGLSKVVSRYTAIEIASRDCGIALITWSE